MVAILSEKAVGRLPAASSIASASVRLHVQVSGCTRRNQVALAVASACIRMHFIGTLFRNSSQQAPPSVSARWCQGRPTQECRSNQAPIACASSGCCTCFATGASIVALAPNRTASLACTFESAPFVLRPTSPSTGLSVILFLHRPSDRGPPVRPEEREERGRSWEARPPVGAPSVPSLPGTGHPIAPPPFVLLGSPHVLRA